VGGGVTGRGEDKWAAAAQEEDGSWRGGGRRARGEREGWGGGSEGCAGVRPEGDAVGVAAYGGRAWSCDDVRRGRGCRMGRPVGAAVPRGKNGIPKRAEGARRADSRRRQNHRGGCFTYQFFLHFVLFRSRDCAAMQPKVYCWENKACQKIEVSHKKCLCTLLLWE
jgi:hypothetical protein